MPERSLPAALARLEQFAAARDAAAEVAALGFMAMLVIALIFLGQVALQGVPKKTRTVIACLGPALASPVLGAALAGAVYRAQAPEGPAPQQICRDVYGQLIARTPTPNQVDRALSLCPVDAAAMRQVLLAAG